MKDFPLKIKKYWAKIYLNSRNKLAVRDKLIAAFPKRYSNDNNHKREVAHSALKRWSFQYNHNIMNNKKGRPKNSQKYKRQGKLEDLHPNDLKIYIKILEEIIEDHNVSKTEVLEKIRKWKNQVKNKKKTSTILGITRQKIYELPKGLH